MERTLSIGGLEGTHLERWLNALLARWGVRREDRDDLIQETYCRWLERAPARAAARQPAQERCYLARVARTVVIDQARAQRTAKRGGHLAAATPPHDPALHSVRDPAPTAEERLLRRERRGALLRTCAAACRRRRRRDVMIVRLAWLDGLSSSEIARLAGGRLRVGSIDSLLTRVRLRLRRDGISLPSRR